MDYISTDSILSKLQKLVRILRLIRHKTLDELEAVEFMDSIKLCIEKI